MEENHRFAVFASRIAHDLRSPLSMTDLQLRRLVPKLERYAAHHPEALEFLRLAQAALEPLPKITELTEQLAEAPELLLAKRTAIPFVAAVTTRAHLANTRFSRDFFRVSATPEAQRIGISITPDDWESILVNLGFNAFKYGRDRCWITLDALRVGDGLAAKLVFADNGPGIPEEQLERIFLKGVRGNHPDVNGTGLGLYLVQQILRRYNGRIWAANACEAGGAEFHVILPAFSLLNIREDDGPATPDPAAMAS